MDPFHIFTQPTGSLSGCHSLPLPYLGPMSLPMDSMAPELSLEDTEIPVKLELRFAIESRRFANGLDIPEIDLTPAARDELNEEQLAKRTVRRERNKVAASKCRQKRKQQSGKLEKSSKELETANQDLECLIADLKREKANLELVLNKHKCLLKRPLETERLRETD